MRDYIVKFAVFTCYAAFNHKDISGLRNRPVIRMSSLMMQWLRKVCRTLHKHYVIITEHRDLHAKLHRHILQPHNYQSNGIFGFIVYM